MLLQFSVENYCSIKDKCVLNVVPSAETGHEENLLNTNGHRALNIISIFGANASGKSSLYRALTNSIIIVRKSNSFQSGYSLPFIPFKLDSESSQNPSCFEYRFIASDSKKYVYGFDFTADRIVHEYLYCYNTVRPSMIFEREDEQYKFSRKFKRVLEAASKMNLSNKLLLATAAAWNVECVAPAFEWFLNGIDTYTNDNKPLHSLSLYESDSESYLQFTKKLFEDADIGISDINIETKLMENNSFNMSDVLVNAGLIINNQADGNKAKLYKIITGHAITGKDNKKEIYRLDLHEESTGTQQLFFFAPFIKKALDNGKVIVIDKLDRGLHPLIVKSIVNLFRNKTINKTGAQLIFMTHETTLLSLSMFRRDQIWFTEKERATGVTSIYSLNDMKDQKGISVRKDENIEKAYMSGKYGAIPFIQNEEL